MTAPADLWAVVCADGGLHRYPEDSIYTDGEPAPEDVRLDLADKWECGPHRVVRYVAAPEPEANGGTHAD